MSPSDTCRGADPASADAARRGGGYDDDMDERTRPASARVHRSAAGAWTEADVEERLAVEEPLEIRVNGVAAAVTMRTPGDDLDLAVGFLTTEGVVDGLDDIRAVATVAENTVDVRLAEGVPVARARSADRALYATSSCGVCGKASIDRLLVGRRGVSAPWSPSPDVLAGLPARLRTAQEGFRETGGLHAAALFDATGTLFDVREDVGRHNAVDKVIGARVRADREGFEGLGLVVSSRAGFELVQKSLVVGIRVLATFGAATTLSVEAGREGGLQLWTWVRPDRLVRLA